MLCSIARECCSCSTNELAVGVGIVGHASLEPRTVLATVQSGSVDVEVLADAGAVATADVIDDGVLVLIASALGARAAADEARNVQL